MARRTYIPGDKKKSKKDTNQPKTQTAAVRQAAMAIIKRTREKIDPKVLEAARSALPSDENDINKLFFGEKDLLQEETVPIDREKNLNTLFEFLNGDKISDSMKQKVTAAMKETVL